MCGISGIINKDLANGYNSRGLKAFTDPISHRGPDDVGYILIDASGKLLIMGDDVTPKEVYESGSPSKPALNINDEPIYEFEVALGHRRLSVIDLSPMGHSPMCYNNTRYWITFNGEIYNYKELKKELSILGHNFVSLTDTEVILAAYAEWGSACQQKFNGMWAFCIYDTIAKEIFLSRDRYGIKPLYYWYSPQQSFCFASEIKQFTFLPRWKAILNGQRALDYLLYNMTDHTNETMFKGVFHVPPGHCYKASIYNINTDTSGKIITEKWYQPLFKGYNGSFKEAAKKFETLFKNSVKDHLMSDVVVGAALSGGLDSSAIVCEIDNLLKEANKQDAQETFSFCSSEEWSNEKKWVDEVIKVTNAKTNYVYLKVADVFEKTEELIWYNDEPTQSQSLLASYQVYAAAKQSNIKVLLNGQGADEYLSGYGSFNTFRLVEFLKQGKFKKIKEEIVQVYGKGKPDYFKVYLSLCYHLVPAFVKRYFSNKVKSHQALKSIISLKHLRALPLHPHSNIPYKSNSIFNITQRQLLHDPLQKYLRFEDRMSMANSIEARVPFLDHRLVEFSSQLPAAYLDGIGELKKLLLHGLKDILPAAILNRKDKIGFITAEQNWMRTDHTAEFKQMLIKSVSLSKGILKPEALEYFDKVVDGTVPFSYSYWRLIQFGLWMKVFNVESELI